jgi:hypothetical protein
VDLRQILSRSTRRPGSLLIALVAVSIVAGACGSQLSSAGASPVAATSPTNATTESQAPFTGAPGRPIEFHDGTFVVGRDIPAGTYRSRDLSAYCRWTRVDLDGAVQRTYSGSLGVGPEVATILPTDDKFVSAGCGIWSSDLSTIVAPGDPIGDGTYIVGIDLMPGVYHSEPRGRICFWARLSDFTGAKWIESRNERQDATVTILETDKGFQTSGCTGWVRQ